MLDKIKNTANTTLNKIKETSNTTLDKIKSTSNITIEKSKEATEVSIKYGKKLIRKKAIDNIKEKLEFAQKKETDFTKEEMRKMIVKEEKKVVKNLGFKGAVTTILTMFGIANF